MVLAVVCVKWYVLAAAQHCSTWRVSPCLDIIYNVWKSIWYATQHIQLNAAPVSLPLWKQFS